MERKTRLLSRILIISILTILIQGCNQDIDSDYINNDKEYIKIEFNLPDFITKSNSSQESAIHDINLMIFHDTELEHKEWFIYDSSTSETRELELIKGHEYSFFAYVNFGFEINVNNWNELHNLKLDISEIPRTGLLMSGACENKIINGKETIVLSLTHMEAKISLTIDRSQLSNEVRMTVKKVSIGNSMKYLSTTGINKAENKYDCIQKVSYLNDSDCMPLNIIKHGGVSDKVTLYIPENMQGDFPIDIEEDDEKVFQDGDPAAERCTFIEIEFLYTSNENFSTEKNLIYRFYLGEGRQNLDVERNCHYSITVVPKGTGLSGTGWRVDKTGIGTYIQQILLSEQQCKLSYKGQQNLLEAEIIPADATYKDVIWKSSNTKIATVGYDGTVTAMGEGECDIICTANDKSGVQAICKVQVKFASPSFNIYPGNYVSGKVGDSIHIWCEFYPPYAPFDIGYEELNFDKERGIYDYTIDKDGHGVTLKLKKAGTGLLYMTVGDPINDSGLVIVEVQS